MRDERRLEIMAACGLLVALGAKLWFQFAIGYRSWIVLPGIPEFDWSEFRRVFATVIAHIAHLGRPVGAVIAAVPLLILSAQWKTARRRLALTVAAVAALASLAFLAGPILSLSALPELSQLWILKQWSDGVEEASQFFWVAALSASLLLLRSRPSNRGNHRRNRDFDFAVAGLLTMLALRWVMLAYGNPAEGHWFPPWPVAIVADLPRGGFSILEAWISILVIDQIRSLLSPSDRSAASLPGFAHEDSNSGAHDPAWRRLNWGLRLVFAAMLFFGMQWLIRTNRELFPHTGFLSVPVRWSAWCCAVAGLYLATRPVPINLCRIVQRYRITAAGCGLVALALWTPVRFVLDESDVLSLHLLRTVKVVGYLLGLVAIASLGRYLAGIALDRFDPTPSASIRRVGDCATIALAIWWLPEAALSFFLFAAGPRFDRELWAVHDMLFAWDVLLLPAVLLSVAVFVSLARRIGLHALALAR